MTLYFVRVGQNCRRLVTEIVRSAGQVVVGASIVANTKESEICQIRKDF